MVELRPREARRRAALYVIIPVVLLAGSWLLTHVGWRSGPDVHTLQEVVATLLAAIVGTLSLVRYYSRKEQLFLVIGAAFLGTAALDAFHANFRPGNLGYPCFDTAFARIGVYICYDRHFPEGARALGLNGAEIVFNPSATVAGLSEYLWRLEQPAHAVANGYFIGAINRVGHEQPWDIGEFYGQSYFCDPRGQFIAEAPRDEDALVVADLDLEKIREVRNTWQFFRDRRPDSYGALVAD
jgi:hypothetical protein